MPPIALIAPDVRRAEATAHRLAPAHGRLAPYSLEGFLRSRRRVLGIVIDAGAGSARQAAEFIGQVRRRLLLPAPAACLGAAIAGLRDEPEESGAPRSRGTGKSGLLLEGAVTPARARRAIARPELSRDWIVEDPRHVRLTEREFAQLEREGVRWFALRPLTLKALVSDRPLARFGSVGGLRTRGVPVWTLARAL